jgi:hypothetical protein
MTYIENKTELEKAIQQQKDLIAASPEDAKESLTKTLEILEAHKDYLD